ncbi:MAG: hypothetical protein LBH09_02090, partial [Peptococcaceae bacterium]|nr:hypothetical protein [Peptococcaceae bacterium]
MEAKIQQPLISSEFVHRERLIARMKDESKRLVLLHAPMGYGKTVLLTQYAQNAREDCVWYHLSDMDNDGVLFMQYLSASIKKSLPAFDFDFQDYAPLLQEEDAFEAMIHDFAYKTGEAVSASGRGAVLILDDFQVINCEDIYRVIRLLLDHTGKK